MFSDQDGNRVVPVGGGVSMMIVTFSTANATLAPALVEFGSIKDGKVVSGSVSKSGFKFFSLKTGKEVEPNDLYIDCACGKSHPVADCVITAYTGPIGNKCLDGLGANFDVNRIKKTPLLKEILKLSSK